MSAPGMLDRGQGHIVNVSSIAGYVGLPHPQAYAAAKSGLIGFTSTLRADYRGSGVSASTLILRVLDATDAAGLRALGENRFDAVVSNMALMDIADLRPLAASLVSLLKPSGRVVFTTAHPCFFHSGASKVAEEYDTGGSPQVTYSVRVTRYLSLMVDKGLGVPGQQVAQYYFDRPLHRLLAPFFAAGLVLDGLEEPAFDESVPNRQQTRWGGGFHEIPPVLAVRLRPH